MAKFAFLKFKIKDMKHTPKDWFVVTRFWSFPVSAMPVIVATVFLLWKGYDIRWLCATLALVGNVMFHAAGNVLSDWCDYRKGVDNEKAYAIPQLVFHQFEPKEYLKFSAVLFAVAICIGLVLTLMTGWQLLIIGGIGALLAASYAFFKFRGMGDMFVFVCFGVLHDNNTVDIATDREAGIRTLPMLFGEKTSVKIYIAYMVIPFVAVMVCCILGYLPYLALTCLLAVPVAFGNINAAAEYFEKGREAMLGLDQKTAKLHMIFSILLAIGLLVASFL